MSGQGKSVGPTVAIWLLLAIAVTAAIYWGVAQGKLTWTDASNAVAWARELVAGNLAIALIAYFAFFVMASLLLFPAQLWVILLGGILFGFPLGAATSWAAAMTSSILVFLLARGTLGAFYRRRTEGFLQKVGSAFQKDQIFYMLTLRFIPVVPYCIANVLPAILGARLRGYAATTAIGVLPYVSVYSFAGSRAGAILDPEFQLEIGRVAGELLPVMFAFALLPLLALGMKRLVNARKAPRPADPAQPADLR